MDLYLQSFESHVHQFKDHLNGISEDHSTTLVPPGSYWTSSEKDSLFHALAVHSRLRPDLIAANVPTKNIFEVSTFLNVLRNSSAQCAPPTRDQFPIAHEVSDHFIAWEGNQADLIIAREQAPPPLSSDEMAADLNILTPDILKYLGSIIHIPSQTEAPQPSSSTAPPPSTPPPTSYNPDDNIDPVLYGLSNPQHVARTSPEPSTDILSPQSKRRYMKRLHMRKKRAMLKGVEHDPNFAVQRAGRKSKHGPADEPPPKPKPKPKRKTTTPAIIDDSDEYLEGDDGQDHSMEDQDPVLDAGSKFAQQMEAVIKSEDLTPELLEQHGLDLFNLVKFRRILKCNRAGHWDDTTPTTTSLTLSLFTLLKDVLRDFLAKIIQTTYTIWKQEHNVKGSKRTWMTLHNDEILPKHIDHAVYLTGLTGHRHNYDFDHENESGSEQERSSEMSSHSRKDHPPYLLPYPQEFFQPNVHHLFPEMNPQPSSEPTDSLMDEEALETELDDEIRLDDVDTKHDTEHEFQLHEHYRRH